MPEIEPTKRRIEVSPMPFASDILVRLRFVIGQRVHHRYPTDIHSYYPFLYSRRSWIRQLQLGGHGYEWIIHGSCRMLKDAQPPTQGRVCQRVSPNLNWRSPRRYLEDQPPIRRTALSSEPSTPAAIGICGRNLWHSHPQHWSAQLTGTYATGPHLED